MEDWHPCKCRYGEYVELLKQSRTVFDTSSKTFRSVSAKIYAYFTWICGLSGALYKNALIDLDLNQIRQGHVQFCLPGPKFVLLCFCFISLKVIVLDTYLCSCFRTTRCTCEPKYIFNVYFNILKSFKQIESVIT